MMAGRDYDDILIDCSSFYTAGMDDAIEQDVIIDLRPLMEENMPFFTALLSEMSDDTKRSLITANGAIPGVAALSGYNSAAGAGLMVRTDYLEKVGMEIPTTYDELNEVVTAFKSELGLAQPIMLAADIVYTNNTLCAGYDVFGCFATSGFMASPWYQVDGVAKFGIVEDGYREYLEMIRQWYEEGLVYSDFIDIG